MKKKEYIAPQMETKDMTVKVTLLAGSMGGIAPDIMEGPGSGGAHGGGWD